MINCCCCSISIHFSFSFFFLFCIEKAANDSWSVSNKLIWFIFVHCSIVRNYFRSNVCKSKKKSPYNDRKSETNTKTSHNALKLRKYTVIICGNCFDRQLKSMKLVQLRRKWEGEPCEQDDWDIYLKCIATSIYSMIIWNWCFFVGEHFYRMHCIACQVTDWPRDRATSTTE